MKYTYGLEPDYFLAIERLLNYLCFGQTNKPEPSTLGYYYPMGDFKFSNPYKVDQRAVVTDFLTNFKEIGDHVQEKLYENHSKKSSIDAFLKDAVQHTETIYYDTFSEGGAIRMIILNMEKNLFKLIYFPVIKFAYVRSELQFVYGDGSNLAIDKYFELLYDHGILLETEEVNFDDLRIEQL